MNGYLEDEKRGRDKFSDDFNPYYYILFTTGATDRVDFFMTSYTRTQRTYVGDIKNYDETRPYSKFKNYMIDVEKLRAIMGFAKDGRIPLLVCYFPDITIVWDLRRVAFEDRKEWRLVNKDGQHYGEKEYSCVTYLWKEEAVWTRTIS